MIVALSLSLGMRMRLLRRWSFYQRTVNALLQWARAPEQCWMLISRAISPLNVGATYLNIFLPTSRADPRSRADLRLRSIDRNECSNFERPGTACSSPGRWPPAAGTQPEGDRCLAPNGS